MLKDGMLVSELYFDAKSKSRKKYGKKKIDETNK